MLLYESGAAVCVEVLEWSGRKTRLKRVERLKVVIAPPWDRPAVAAWQGNFWWTPDQAPPNLTPPRSSR